MDTRSLWWWNSTQLSKSWCFFLPCQPIPFPSRHSETLNCGHPESKGTINQSITRSGVSSTLSKAIWWPKKTPTLTRTNWRKTPTMAYKQETNSPPAPEITQLLLIHIYTWKKQISPTSHKQIPTTSTLHINPTLTLSSFKFFSTLPWDHQILLPSPQLSNTPTQVPLHHHHNFFQTGTTFSSTSGRTLARSPSANVCLQVPDHCWNLAPSIQQQQHTTYLT